ncbi:sulfotransferase family protein [Truepera radiovictrix]|uniref:sulfotransferase family protein n=1 Tax=Truepera radiovictrix TaxID=332249 RepID=UPI001622595F|nr:sulfotransferase [Truepera radiovictrix]WMT58547.1 sulfotransferase [Truepera radiovictrix]
MRSHPTTLSPRGSNPVRAHAAPLRDRLRTRLYALRFSAEVWAAGRRKDVAPRYPDFLGIGTPRSATTWLHLRLAAHPGVFLPARKELHFFNEPRPHTPCRFSGATWTRPLYFDLENPAHWRWYAAQFAGAGERRCGEITPDYATLSRERVGEVLRHLPEVKVILNIRNPIARAWSGLRYSWRRHIGRYTDRQLGERLREELTDALIAAALHPERLLRGDYPRTIGNWEAHVPPERLLYLFYDDIARDPGAELRRVADFLELDPAGLPPSAADTSPVNDAPATDMPDAVKERLVAYYAPHIRWLEAHFGRDLSAWLEL